MLAPIVARLAAVGAASAAGVVVPLAAHTVHEQAPAVVTTAEIVPANDFAAGDSLAYGDDGDANGFSLMANDVNGQWSVGAKTTINVCFFVFSTAPNTPMVISYDMVSPAGTTVTKFAYKATTIGKGGTQFSAAATGNYSAKGVYFFKVYSGATLIGQVPLYFS
jgi:hypothetical protein